MKLPSPVCPDCGIEVAPGLLACPGCRRLVHSDDLKRLSAEAEKVEQAGDAPGALALWREALELLPRDSRQSEEIAARIESLHRRAPRGKSALAKGAAGAGAAALVLWKFKFILAFILTKGKLLLLGLTKMSTLLSMFAFFAVYWNLWGWKFALGLVVSLYIHEMGHVAMLRRYGIKADPPMFIPGLGAFVRLRQYPAGPVEDARVGLAGPIWGLGAAVAAYLLFLATRAPYWGAISVMGATLNLFNLIPIWQLDGGRGFRSLTRNQRWIATLASGGALLMTGEGIATGMLLLILLGALYRSIRPEPVARPDPVGLLQYVVLIAALTALAAVRIPVGSP